MSTAKQAAVKKLKMSERAQQKLELHFPGYDPLLLWRRKMNDGYTTLPRTLTYAMQAIDDRTKGQPAGHTLFCLWARSPDHPLLTIENPALFAAEAGFRGERAVHTWRGRMKRLQQLEFLIAKKGALGDFHHVLLLNPNVAVEKMRQMGHVQTDLYDSFVDRLNDVGGFGDIQVMRTKWEAEKAAKAAADAAAAQGQAALPPLPPLPPPASEPVSGGSSGTPTKGKS